jgi:hypothetical protein
MQPAPVNRLTNQGYLRLAGFHPEKPPQQAGSESCCKPQQQANAESD